MKNIQLITIRNVYGAHTDVYKDFEKEIVKQTGWIAVEESMPILQRIFEKFFLSQLQHKTFPFNLPTLNRDRILFASLSGIEYVKIIQQYLFQAQLKVVYQFDSWTHDNAINENAFRSFKINIAFISIKKASEYFNSLNIPGFKAYWMPEAIYSERYRFIEYDKKNIDVLQYGRRWEWLHKQIQPFCREHNIHYIFPQENGDTKFRFKDRDELIDDLSRTKIAICVPRTITEPDLYDLPALTTRYFECMASKCLILGHAPQDLITLYGYNPVVEVDYLKPLDQLQYLLDHFHDFVPLIEKNYKITKERHQWKNRITDMRNIINDHCEKGGSIRHI